MLAFGSTLVTAPSANAATVKVVDGLWGKETSAGVQRLMNLLYPQAGLVVDGVISSQPSRLKQPGLATFGWEWVPDNQAAGSPTMYWMHKWLGDIRHGLDSSTAKYHITHSFILRYKSITVFRLTGYWMIPPKLLKVCKTKLTSGLVSL